MTSLKKLREKYKEICSDLVEEENFNIQATTSQILMSEDYRRASINTKSNMISEKIIEIRDEYRNVMDLLKN